LIGVHFTVASFLLIALTVFLVAFSLTALGFAIAWPMDSTQAFHAIINLFLIPLWLLSGSLFPVSSASRWLKVLMLVNPLTYGTEALRGLMYPGTASVDFPVGVDLAILGGFALVMFGIAFALANRRTTKPAA
jgi:ABC-2 type transport system permease protein